VLQIRTPGEEHDLAIVNIGNLLDRTAAFEKRLDRYYAGIRDRSRDNGVRLLTHYLSRHRRHLPEVLNDYSPKIIKRVRDVKCRRNILFVLKKDFHALDTPPDKVNGQALLHAAIKYDRALINLYRKIMEEPLIGLARELFENLIRVEKRDIVVLKRMVAMDYF